MNEVLKWLSAYSPAIVLLLSLGAAFIFILKFVTEKTIANAFDRYKKTLELKLEKRSNFEEKILLDRYLVIRELQTKIGTVMTNLNRIRHGATVEGFEVNNDIVPLTEVFELLAVNKYLITDKFHSILWQQAHIALQFSNETDAYQQKQLEEKYLALLQEFYTEMNAMFQLEKIKWEA